MTFGKVMGGGFPAAAFGGRADVMARLAPEGPVYQAGTLSGNPIATTAGLTTLRLATDEVYAHIAAAGDTIKAGRGRGADRRRRAARHPGDRHHVLGVLHRRAGPRLRRTPAARTSPAFAAFFHAMLDAGSTCRRRRTRHGSCPRAHDDRAVQTMLDALPAAARAAAAAPRSPMSDSA